jgi:hypothetical protein
MDISSNIITLDVGGQIFKTDYMTITKIPYFNNMFGDCSYYDFANPIFVNRSAHIFKHVLAMAIDPLYMYPKKYTFELDFYGVDYSKLKLYDKNESLIKDVENQNSIIMSTNDEIHKINTQLNRIDRNINGISEKVEVTKTMMNNLTKNNPSINKTSQQKCRYNCGRMASPNKNYCMSCVSLGTFCDHFGCDIKRGFSSYYCNAHKFGQNPNVKLW